MIETTHLTPISSKITKYRRLQRWSHVDSSVANDWLRADSSVANDWLRADSSVANDWLRADSSVANDWLRDIFGFNSD